MSYQGENLGLVLSFFSRIPVPAFLANRISTDAKLTNAIAWFPIVGLVIGLFPACVFYLASLFFPALIAAGLAVLTGLLVTGALHEDGLADCADGLGATPEREKALEIMRDSRVGSYGVLAMILSVGLRWAALASLSPVFGFLALLIAHSASRSSMTIAMRVSRYARPTGLGQMASGELPKWGFETAIASAFAFATIFGWLSGIAAVAIGLLSALLMLLYLEKRLDGYTGDGLGAMQQVAEITILIVLAGFWT